MSDTPQTRIPVVITVDTEPDNIWADHHSRGVRNIHELLRLQALLDEFGARATLLVTHQMVTRTECVEVLKRLTGEHGAEVGAHLHPWENPPFDPSGYDRRYHTFPHELKDVDFRRKLEVLTEAIRAPFGQPVSYRAGRYGFKGAHVRVLEDLGYRVDTSVTPFEDWRATRGLPINERGLGGIDYRRAPLDPYHPDYGDVTRPGTARLWEVPVTVYATRAMPDFMVRAFAHLPVRLRGALRRTTGLTLAWARPTGQAPGATLQMLAALQKRPARIVNIMFHSSELLLGGSPSTGTEAAVDAVFENIRGMLEWLTAHSRFEFLTLADAARSLCPVEA